MKYIGLFLLALWLIVQNFLTLTGLHFPFEKLVLPSVALTAGIVILFHVIKTKLGDIGLFLLSIWLLLRSSQFLYHFTFPHSDMTIAVLGVVAGIFIIIKK